jgi:hypothetical protein
MFGFQSVEDCETVPDGGPVYSYTRQQLTGKTIHQNNPGLYERMEELQTKLSLVVAGLDLTKENERYLTPAQDKVKQGMSKKPVQGGFSCGLCLCLCACLWVCSHHCPANVCLCV